MTTRRCAYDPSCRRIPPPFRGMCPAHEEVVMSSIFGPRSWQERRELGVLTPMVELPLTDSPTSAEPHAPLPVGVARSGARRGAVAPRAAA